MILIDGRIASLKFRKHLYCYLEKIPSTPIEIPKFTFSDLLKLIIYIFTIPIMTLITESTNNNITSQKYQ